MHFFSEEQVKMTVFIGYFMKACGVEEVEICSFKTM